ncbi:MAG: hypothetical protein HF977_09540 [ANME-2 cluster archaeon]|nr:hypothetical protein [ANME-2 cluster archaeon]
MEANALIDIVKEVYFPFLNKITTFFILTRYHLLDFFNFNITKNGFISKTKCIPIMIVLEYHSN